MKTITYDDTLYQLVPKEATREMLNAAIDVDSFKLGDISPIGFRCSPQQLFERCYRSMLSAAPTPPAQPEPGFHNCTFSNEPVQTTVVIAGESAQTPAQPAERKPLTEEQIDSACMGIFGSDYAGVLTLSLQRAVARAIETAHGIKE